MTDLKTRRRAADILTGRATRQSKGLALNIRLPESWGDRVRAIQTQRSTRLGGYEPDAAEIWREALGRGLAAIEAEEEGLKSASGKR